jgi:UV DNA damage endonuclease
MIRHLGYACINETLKPRKFRTCRLKTIETKGIEVLKEIVLHNLDLLKDIIEWNHEHDIHFYRVSSDLIPLSTHPVVLEKGFIWQKDPDIKKALLEINKKVLAYKMRISMHPDQYTVLNTLKEDVLVRSIEYLQFHADLLEAIGGQDMILHVGGVYGDKISAKKRFVDQYMLLNDTIKGYLRLENDDKSYTIHDVIEIHQSTGVPIVFDYHHHRCHHEKKITKEDIDIIYSSWQGIPKTHLSTGKAHATDRSHHDYVKLEDLQALDGLFGDKIIDVMVEAKKKDFAVLELKNE